MAGAPIEPTTAPVALSFAFAARTGAAQQRRAVGASLAEDAPHRELITGVEGSKIRPAVAAEQPQPTRYIVARLENTYRTGGPQKFTPSFRPPANDAPTIADGVDRFEVATTSGLPNADPSMYGLQVSRKLPAAATAAAGGGALGADSGGAGGVKVESGLPDAAATAADAAAAPQELVVAAAAAMPAWAVAAGGGDRGGGGGPRLTDAQTLARDMEALPEEASLEAYEDLPIEHFGRAMLMGMGWVEGQGVGRKRKDVSAIEYVRRPERLGLGAAPVPVLPNGKAKVVKMGDKPARQDMVLAPDADGRQRNVRQLDEKLVLRSSVLGGPQPGKTMKVTEGRHEGLECRVLVLLPAQEGRSARASVRLTASDTTVEVRCKDLAELWDKKAPAPPPAPAAPSGRGGCGGGTDGATTSRGGGDEGGDARREGKSSKRDRGGEDGRSGGGGTDGRDGGRPTSKQARGGGTDAPHGGSSSQRRERDMPPPPPREALWLSQYIKVRVLDKQSRKGTLYLKKGTVIDVHPGGLADVSVDDTADVVQLPQSLLETVVPKGEGAPLLIVRGPLRGQRARLLEVRKAEGIAAVQLVEDCSLQRLELDDIAQFMGSMED